MMTICFFFLRRFSKMSLAFSTARMRSSVWVLASALCASAAPPFAVDGAAAALGEAAAESRPVRYQTALPAIRLGQPNTHGVRSFVDADGYERHFHGVNAVVKGPPWHPTVGFFDHETSLVKEDFEVLQAMGVLKTVDVSQSPLFS